MPFSSFSSSSLILHVLWMPMFFTGWLCVGGWRRRGALQVGYPLFTTLVCVSEEEGYLSAIDTTADFLIKKLKDRETRWGTRSAVRRAGQDVCSHVTKHMHVCKYIYIYIYILYAWCKHVHVCTYTCAWVHIRCMLYSRVDVFGQSVMLRPTHGHPHACSQLCMHARRFSHPTFAHTKASLCMHACVRAYMFAQTIIQTLGL